MKELTLGITNPLHATASVGPCGTQFLWYVVKHTGPSKVGVGNLYAKGHSDIL